MSSGRTLGYFRSGVPAKALRICASESRRLVSCRISKPELISSSQINYSSRHRWRHAATSINTFNGLSSNSKLRERGENGHDSGREDNQKDEQNSGWKWKVASCAGLLLAGILKPEKINVLPDWFTVHAARPIEGDFNNDYYERRGSTGGSRSDIYKNSNELNGTLKLSRRLQFNFIADVVESASKAVVCIEVKDHSMIDWFHGAPQTASNGSGFIISEDGLILTNAHVVNARGRTSISVHLNDGRRYAGYVEAIDPEGDLALVRIKETGLPTLKLGNSSETRIGEWVAAIGSPLSLSNSVTAGVVSNVKRGAQELGLRNRISYIQTDAAITFGNSGGPLVNLDGEAIGVNSMKVTAGISFAIPSDYVKRFIAEVEERRKDGKIKPFRRYLGVTLVQVTEELVGDLDQRGACPVTKGALVWKVVVGSPAYLAGIQPGDVIVKINDKDIVTVSDVYEAMEQAEVLEVIVVREGRRYKCRVHPEDQPVYG